MLYGLYIWNIASVNSSSDVFLKFKLNTYCSSTLYVQQGSLQDPANTVRQKIREISHLTWKINTEQLQFYIYSYIDIYYQTDTLQSANDKLVPASDQRNTVCTSLTLHIFSGGMGFPKRKCLVRAITSQAHDKLALQKYHISWCLTDLL